MCGIVGLAMGANSAPATQDQLRQMANAIVHRGPDDEGFFVGERVMLGMRRLSIIDLSGGHQPIANEDETLWLVCNGEIYNFRELRAGLEKQGHRFRTGSDVEVLLHLYEEHGDNFLDQVSGMFGFALWDSRRERLTIGRDRFGQKPLYYTINGGRLAFASEIKSLLALPEVRAQIDPQALREHLALGYAVAPNTIFRGIKKLPPASKLVWTAAGWRVESYWTLPQATEERSESSWVELMRSELERSVAEHMVSDVPIGAFLSGGVDSSAIVALMAKHTSSPVNTYSIGYGGDGAGSYYNELEYAGQVARQFSTHHHEIVVRPDVATLLPKLMWHLEEPISDSATATTYLVSELAAKSVKVILSGVGGDELFAGYRRYLGGHYGERYRRLPGWLRKSVVRPLAEALPSGRENRLMDLARYAKSFVRASELGWREQYRSFIEIQSRERVSALLADSLAGEDGYDRVAAGERAEDSLLQLFRTDSQTSLPEGLLLLTDKITMATSIECRVPFLDHRLAEAAARIPASVKLRGGELKHVLKRALEGVLPPEILYRRKRGFGAPIGSWFKSELAPLRNVLLNASTIERRGLLRWPGVQHIVSLHDAGREDFTDLILVLMNLEIWSRVFLDGATPADVGGELTERTLAA
jgi:asparagine synthase (glutamine-hydrolysing)